MVVAFPRRSDAILGRFNRSQPFGAAVSDFPEVAGCRLPFRVEAVNMFCSRRYFPCFLADVTDIRFPGARR